MNVKRKIFIALLVLAMLLGMSSQLNLVPDRTNPLQIRSPSTAWPGSQIDIKFSFPEQNKVKIDPESQSSNGLKYSQVIGVVFPSNIGTSLLEFSKDGQFDCALSNGVYSYKVSPLVSDSSENNIAFCQLDDVSMNTPLATGPENNYTVSIRLNFEVTEKYIRSMGVFTATSNHTGRVVIDTLPFVGNGAFYGNWQTFADPPLFLDSAEVEITSGTTNNIQPYNTFDTILKFKISEFIFYKDHQIVIKYPKNTVNAPGTVNSERTSTLGDTTPTSLADNGLKTFQDNAISYELAEDLRPTDYITITLKGWRALDTNLNQSENIEIFLYYRNTYVVRSYQAKPIFNVQSAKIDMNIYLEDEQGMNNIDDGKFVDVFRNGAYPITFEFWSNETLQNGAWVVIQQENALVSSTAGNRVSFQAATCDFSDSRNSGVDNAFQKRHSCFPLRTDFKYNNGGSLTAIHGGSGIFFRLKNSIAANKKIYVTVWLYFDDCGGYRANIFNNSDTFVTPSFSIKLLTNIDKTKMNEDRFNLSNVSNPHLLGRGTEKFAGKCWNDILHGHSACFDADATNCWSSTGIGYPDALAMLATGASFVSQASIAPTASGANTQTTAYMVDRAKLKYTGNTANGSGKLYTLLNENNHFRFLKQNSSTPSDPTWETATTPELLELSRTTYPVGYLYSQNNNIAGSYFLMESDLPLGTGAAPFVTPHQSMAFSHRTLGDGTDAAVVHSGRLIVNLSRKWFTAGDPIFSNGTVKRNCYLSWFWPPMGDGTLTTEGAANAFKLFQTETSLKTALTRATNTNRLVSYYENGLSGALRNEETDFESTYTNVNNSDYTKRFRLVSKYNGGFYKTAANLDPIWYFGIGAEKAGAAEMLKAVTTATSLMQIKWDPTTPVTHNKFYYYTNCIKFVSPIPEVKSIYSSIEVQFNWYFVDNTRQTDLGIPMSINRYVKLFPEGGVFQDETLFDDITADRYLNPYKNHMAYAKSTTEGAICLIEIEGKFLQSVENASLANSLVIFISDGVLLETDYNDPKATYPISANSKISAYGLQNARPYSEKNHLWGLETYTTADTDLVLGGYPLPGVHMHYGWDLNLLFGPGLFKPVDGDFATGLTVASKSGVGVAGLQLGEQDQAYTSYNFYLGSVLVLNGIENANITSDSTDDDTPPLFIPYYCPVKYPSDPLFTYGRENLHTFFPTITSIFMNFSGGFDSFNNEITAIPGYIWRHSWDNGETEVTGDTNLFQDITAITTGFKKAIIMLPQHLYKGFSYASFGTAAWDFDGAASTDNVFGQTLIEDDGTDDPTTASTVLSHRASKDGNIATLKFRPYSDAETGDDEVLYLFNGTKTIEGIRNQTCTGHVFLLHKNIEFTNQTPTFYGINGIGAVQKFSHDTTFYAFGKPFNKSIYAGLGKLVGFVEWAAAPATRRRNLIPDTADTYMPWYSVNLFTRNMVRNIVKSKVEDTVESSPYYIKGIKRPSLSLFKDNFNIMNMIAYSCAAADNVTVDYLTNYIPNLEDGSVGHFLVMFNPALSYKWKLFTISEDLDDSKYRDDVAGNIRLKISTPLNFPSGTIMNIASTVNFNDYTICGLVMENDRNKIIHNCGKNESEKTSVECKLFGGQEYDVCCYNVKMADNKVELSILNVEFPNNLSKDFENYVYNTMYSFGNTNLKNNAWDSNSDTAPDVINNESISIESIKYYQVNQSKGMGKVTFIVKLPRLIVRDMTLKISGDFSKMMVPQNKPRCFIAQESRTAQDYLEKEVIWDYCSTDKFNENIDNIVIGTKSIVYKCGMGFTKKIYLTLWPVLQVDWNTTESGFNNSFTLNAYVGGVDAIVKNETAVQFKLHDKIGSAPAVTGQWDTLCAVTNIQPRIPGSYAEYTFNIDTETNKTTLANTTLNELTLFFPYKYFGGYMQDILCYYDNNLQNCSFEGEGILNVRFTQNLPIGTGKAIEVKIVGIVNPYINDNAVSIPCTVNNTDFANNRRTNIITGSGKLNGVITADVDITHGNLIFMTHPEPVLDKNPRSVSVHRFRVAVDEAINQSKQYETSLTINNTPKLYFFFPTDYTLWLYTYKPTVLIEEFTSDVNQVISKTKTITPSTINIFGNAVVATFAEESHTFETNFRYWDITIGNIYNPQDNTNKDFSPNNKEQTTRPFKITLTNSNMSVLYQTYDNANTYSTVALPTKVNDYLQWNRGMPFAFSNNSWIVDFYATYLERGSATNFRNLQTNTPLKDLNRLTIKAGRYLRASMVAKQNSSTTIVPSVTDISLSDNIFKMAKTTVTYASSYKQPVDFYIGAPCGTSTGFHIVRFSSTEKKLFTELSPVLIQVQVSDKATIRFVTPATIPAAAEAWIMILLSEPNFDPLEVKWSPSTQNLNHATAAITDVVVPAASFTTYANYQFGETLDKVYSKFTITTPETTLPPQTFTTSDPNNCFTWNGQNNLTINIKGVTAIIPSTVNLADGTFFEYFNSESDPTLPEKNSVKFTFKTQWAPIFIYCAITCINKEYPSDNAILTPWNQKKFESFDLRYVYTDINTVSPIDLIFRGLYRGKHYHLRCIIESTQADVNLRTSSNVNFEKYVYAGVTNQTSVPITPTPTRPSQCADFQFTSDPGISTKITIINYCQYLFSLLGYFKTGCIICTNSEIDYTVPGLKFANSTCENNPELRKNSQKPQEDDSEFRESASNKGRIRRRDRRRFLQFAGVNDGLNNNPSATTAYNPISYSVCPTPNPLCVTDSTGNFDYQEQFERLKTDLKTQADFNQKLNILNVPLNETLPSITVTDQDPLDMTELQVKVTQATSDGFFAITASFSTSIKCNLLLQEGTEQPSLQSVIECTDRSRCALVKITKFTKGFSTPKADLVPFSSNSYSLWGTCTNDVPLARQRTPVFLVTTVTVSGSGTGKPNTGGSNTTGNTTSTNTTTTTTSSAGFIRFDLLLMVLALFLF